MVSTSTKAAPVKPGAAGMHILSERKALVCGVETFPVEYPEDFN